MNVPQTFVYDFSACACKQLYLVAVIVKYFFQKCEMHGQHLRYKNSVFSAHFLSEKQSALLVVNQFRHKGQSSLNLNKKFPNYSIAYPYGNFKYFCKFFIELMG